MAAMAETPKPERLGVPSRNPLPLSASQEDQVRDIFYARVRKQCADEIKGACCASPSAKSPSPSNGHALWDPSTDRRHATAFAACALGRTFSVSFACRAEHRAMNSCMKLHASPEEHDAAREEWFAMRLERQRKREHDRNVAAAQEEFIREWWGLPEDVRLSRQREMEKRYSEERVGGMPAKDRPIPGR